MDREHRYYEVDPNDPDALPFMREYLITYMAVLQRTLFIKKLAAISARENRESLVYLKGR